MYRKCATERSAQNQRRLENALLELMLKMPYEDISVTRLCEEAGISRRVFYHLFSGKEGILHGLIDHRILDIESYRTDLSDQTIRFFLYWRSQEKLLDALRQNQRWSMLLERMLTSVLQEDYDVRHWLRAEDPENRQDILVFNLSGIMGLVFRWHESGFRKSPERMCALIGELMKNPLAKD